MLIADTPPVQITQCFGFTKGFNLFFRVECVFISKVSINQYSSSHLVPAMTSLVVDTTVLITSVFNLPLWKTNQIFDEGRCNCLYNSSNGQFVLGSYRKCLACTEVISRKVVLSHFSSKSGQDDEKSSFITILYGLLQGALSTLLRNSFQQRVCLLYAFVKHQTACFVVTYFVPPCGQPV